MSRPEILHQPENNRFVVPFDDEWATLKYRIENQNDENSGSAVVDFTSTYVPPQHRNSGAGEALVRRGLAWAKEQNHQIEASCWYVDKFLR